MEEAKVEVDEAADNAKRVSTNKMREGLKRTMTGKLTLQSAAITKAEAQKNLA